MHSHVPFVIDPLDVLDCVLGGWVLLRGLMDLEEVNVPAHIGYSDSNVMHTGACDLFLYGRSLINTDLI